MIVIKMTRNVRYFNGNNFVKSIIILKVPKTSSNTIHT